MNNEQAYQSTLDYLYRFVDYSLTRAFRNAPGKFDLGRMFHLMERLGNPQQTYPILHVAGTKGKGSVSALCASALRSAGYRVGLYTSPHLQEYTERIQLDGQPISKDELVALVDELRPVFESIPEITTFEITTALAFVYFARQGATAAVFEVGLGGRLDATNVVQPRVSVITSISYDHTQILGDTLTEIAGEKAGIIKPGIPVVSSPQVEEARLAIQRIAAQRGSPLTLVGRDVHYRPLSHSLEGGQDLEAWQVDGPHARLHIPLLGMHQVENAATAYATLTIAAQNGLALSLEAIQQGFAQVQWPGRFEVLSQRPALVIDSAHNRDSALRLRQALDDYFPGQPLLLVLGASEDKDLSGIFAELMPRATQVIVTRSFHPRAADPAALQELAQQFGREAVICGPVEEALAKAEALAFGDAVIVVTGSIFVAAAARQVWLEQHSSSRQP